jgi:hypothetical protein
VANSGEHGNELSGFVNGEEFLDHRSYCQPLKNSSSSSSSSSWSDSVSLPVFVCHSPFRFRINSET